MDNCVASNDLISNTQYSKFYISVLEQLHSLGQREDFEVKNTKGIEGKHSGKHVKTTMYYLCLDACLQTNTELFALTVHTLNYCNADTVSTKLLKLDNYDYVMTFCPSNII
jgi:hypothetical protein